MMSQCASSDTVPLEKARAKSGWLIFIAWTIAGLVSAIETYTYCNQFKGIAVSFPACFLGRIPPWYVWAIATPAIVWLTNRTRGALRTVGAVLQHLALFTVTTLFFATAYALMDIWTGLAMGNYGLGERIVRTFVGWISVSIFAYVIVVVAQSAAAASRRQRQAERREAALTTELVRAQLSALKSQLQPHFLFNALNTAVAFVRQGDMKTAEHTLLLLSDILRDVLKKGDSADVSLREEVAMLRRYLEIQQLRFADRLRVSWTIEPSLLEARVPQLLLQPVVENAVRHGIARRASAGVLGIRADREGDRLSLTVRDDGPGPPEGFVLTACAGLGLRNIRERLEQQYGEQAELRLERAEGGGTLARILLPLLVNGAEGPDPAHA